MFGFTRAIGLEFQMSFAGIENTTGLLHKIKFYCVYGKKVFPFRVFLSSSRL